MSKLTRPSFEEIYMELAENISKRSSCKRLSVGCVVVSSDFERIFSVGYNGNAKGLPNECDSDEPGKCGCIHAEENAIIKCYDRLEDKILFITHQPCKMCAKKIINLGSKGKILRVYYKNTYRCSEGLDLLHKVGIDTKHTEV